MEELCVGTKFGFVGLNVIARMHESSVGEHQTQSGFGGGWNRRHGDRDESPFLLITIGETKSEGL